MKEYIELQSAHVTQISENSDKGVWKVRKNITSEDLFELPGNLSEETIFIIMEFARKFELKAFNIGINFGKDINKTNVQLATNENIRLSTTIENLTRDE